MSMSIDWCACLTLNVRHTWKIRVFESAALLAISCSTMHVVMASLMSSLLLFNCCSAASVICFTLDTSQRSRTLVYPRYIRSKDVAIG